MALNEGEELGGAGDLTGGAGAGAGAGAGEGAGETGGGDGGAGGAGGGDGGADPDWYANLSADTGEGEASSNRDWIKAQGVKDLDGLTKIARDNQRALRESGRIKVPGAEAKPEELTAFRTAIGVPESVAGYTVAPIENGQFDPNKAEGPDNPKHIPLNEPLIKALSESALKHGTPKGAFEGLVQDFIQLQMDEAATEKARQDGLAQAQIKQWGAASNEQLANVDAAARALDLTRTDMAGLRSGLGADRALALLAKLGSGMAEDTLINGGKGRFGVSGAEASAELDKLKADPEFMKKAMKPGSAEKQRWDRLNATASEWKVAQANKPA